MIIKDFIFLQVLIIAITGCENIKPAEKVVHKEDFYQKCRKLVLSENNVGQEYYFKKTKINEVEVKITYLGKIITKNGYTIKFLNDVNYFGQYEDSKRASGAVLLYNEQNCFLGMYQVGSLNSIPSSIEKDKLVFNYNDENCNQKTEISFLDSIPNKIFINCTKNGGDLYSFIKE